MGAYSSRTQLGYVKSFAIVYFGAAIVAAKADIMHTITAISVALLVSVCTVVARKEVTFKFTCPDGYDYYGVPSIAVTNFPAPAGHRTAFACCPNGFSLRHSQVGFWCCKGGLQDGLDGHCWGNQCTCGGYSDFDHIRPVVAPKLTHM